MSEFNNTVDTGSGASKTTSNQQQRYHQPNLASRAFGYGRAIFQYIPGPLVGLILICVAFSFLSPYFLTSRNLLNIFSQMSEIGIMAAGAALVIIIGGIDLSVGAVLAVSLMVNAWLFRYAGVIFPWP